MMHLFLNGLAASAGGGLTYLRNVAPYLAARGDVRTTIAVQPELRRELGQLPNISFVEFETAAGTARRFWQEQTVLPRLIRQAGADVLLSAGNIALRKSPVPQILLSRNSLYTSADFMRDVRVRHDYGIWLDTKVKAGFAKASIGWADCTVAPSEAFAAELRQWSGRKVVSIHHGFDCEAFFRDPGPLPVDLEQKLDTTQGSLRLLFVSHYNYYRNFETLIRALPELCRRFDGRVKLVLTCNLRTEDNPGSYRANSAFALVRELGMTDHVVELGTVPYRLLHHVYCACDIYVTPAYAESFAHPLVEAMAAGLPVVASDLAVHREICRSAALWFDRFSSAELAERVAHLAGSPELKQEICARGRERARDFSWSKHVDEILQLAQSLAS
jgi:glycosyltransferase involved in cell wall biosynthesis